MERAKALRTIGLGFALFVLLFVVYLAVARALFFLNIISLPLGAAISGDLNLLVATGVAIVNLSIYMLYRRRRVAGTK